VLSVRGEFDRGDAVAIRDARGVTLAHGLSAYASAEAALIIGLRSAEIPAILGYRGREELVHRNDLAMVGPHG
jgi:glutamate 5-kinase